MALKTNINTIRILKSSRITNTKRLPGTRHQYFIKIYFFAPQMDAGIQST